MRIKKVTRKMLVARKIIQLHLEGKSQRKISIELKIHHSTAKKFVMLAKEKGYLDGVPMPPYPEALFGESSKSSNMLSHNEIALANYKDWIVERLNASWHRITIFEQLPIKVTRSSFYRFLQKNGLKGVDEFDQIRVVPEIYHKQGESLQLDWGLIRTIKHPGNDKKTKIWAFIGTLAYSSYMMVRLVFHQDTYTTLKVIEEMLKEIGGVPCKVTSDNPKCFAIEASNYEPLLNPIFERFAEHYQFRIECLPPRDPEKKGRVESAVKYVRRLCESYEIKEFSEFCLGNFQTFVDQKIRFANERKHGTTHRKPLELFIQEEASALKKLPPLVYGMEEFSEAKVRRDGHVRFAGKYYSLEESFIGKEVFIIANEQRISIFYKGKLLETHERLISCARYKSTKKHHLKSWEQTNQDNDFYIQKADKIGINCKSVVEIILGSGQGFVDTRIIWGILSLDKSYRREDIEIACEKALINKMFSYRFIKKLLQHKECDQQEIKSVRPVHAFTRSLAEYQEKIIEIQINTKI